MKSNSNERLVIVNKNAWNDAWARKSTVWLLHYFCGNCTEPHYLGVGWVPATDARPAGGILLEVTPDCVPTDISPDLPIPKAPLWSGPAASPREIVDKVAAEENITVIDQAALDLANAVTRN